MAIGPKPRNSIARFARSMEAVLRRNQYKGGWKNCGKIYLFNCLGREVYELNRNIAINADRKAITTECCDIANFAMMIADLYGCELEAR